MSAPLILIVDDHPTNLKLVSDLLECEGYEVQKAADAGEAQWLLAQRLPDLLLLDLALPGMDGLSLARKLRSEERTRRLPIVALTAFAMAGDEQKAIDAGCDGYLTKPIDTRTLPAKVAGFLPRPEPAPLPESLRILVVEDAPTHLKLAEHVLASAGHQVEGIEGAFHALARVKHSKPQVILLDLLLPDMDALELVRAFKADPETAHIPVVALTAFPEKFPRDQAMAAGCDAYLIKPISTRKLPEQLEQVVRETSSDRT